MHLYSQYTDLVNIKADYIQPVYLSSSVVIIYLRIYAAYYVISLRFSSLIYMYSEYINIVM